jgi:hypothetical protein
VADQVREMRRENESLHDTIAQLRATQSETERRLARVEADHQIKSRQLEQTRIELNRKIEAMAHRLDRVSVNAHASPNAFQSFHSLQMAAPAPAPPPAPPRWNAYHIPPQAHLRAGLGRPLVAPDESTPRAELERYIAQCIPFLQEYDASSLIIRDLQYPPINAPPSTCPRHSGVHWTHHPCVSCVTYRVCRVCRGNDDVWPSIDGCSACPS